MFVGVSTFELHIEQALSLKDKRMVVRSLKDRIRNKFNVSAAEVGLHDLHQRARIGIAVVSGSAATVERLMSSVEDFVEANAEARIIGSTSEVITFDEEAATALPQMDFAEENEEEEQE